MSQAGDILARAQELRVRLRVTPGPSGKDIEYEGDPPPPQSFLEQIRRHKDEVIALLSWSRDGAQPDPGWPIPPGLLCPSGWTVRGEGVFQFRGYTKDNEPKYERVTYAPVFLLGKARDLDTDQEYLTLAYPQEHGWAEQQVKRDELLDARQLVKKSAIGVPVSSGTAGLASTFFADVEALNKSILVVRLVSSSCGWKVVAGERVFVCGDQIISSKGDAPLALLPVGPGDRQRVRALTAKGDFNTWLKTVNRLTPFPRVMFSIYASFVPPLARILESPTFIIDYNGDSSIGKTATLECAASVWGLPPREQGGLIQAWDSTKVYAERMAALSNDLPVFLDDSHTTEKRVLEKTLYMLTMGLGRGRGAVDGTRRTGTWSTVAFSTGEAPLAEASRFGGAQLRTLSLPGSPFESTRLGKFVREVRHALNQHHGHAGALFVKFLLDHGDEWPDYESRYRELVGRIASLFPPGAKNTTDRLATYLAAVEIAGELAIEALGLGGDPELCTREVVRALTGVSELADYGQRAMDHLADQLLANKHNFSGGTYPERLPAQGWWGRWEDDFVAVFPARVREVLEKGGFSYGAATRAWAERGWLKLQEGNLTYPVSVDGHRHRMLCVFQELLGEPPGPEE